MIHHQYPCELTVRIETLAGETVRRLTARRATRPQGLLPLGTTLCWNGRLADGSLAPEGAYRVRVTGFIGQASYEIVSEPFLLRAPQG